MFSNIRAVGVILNEGQDSSATKLRPQLGWNAQKDCRKVLTVCTTYMHKKIP